MTVEVSIDEAQLQEVFNRSLESVKIPVQTAMAETFEVMVKTNIGAVGGEFRPADWPALMGDKTKDGGRKVPSKYAKRVGRLYATLSGKDDPKRKGGKVTLEDSIDHDNFDDYSVVYSRGCEYAAAHQYGEGKMPPRPFFPMTGEQGSEEITEQAMAELVIAAENALANELSK